MSVTNAEIADRVRALRKRWGLSQVQLARIVNMHPTTVSRVEAGAQPLRLAEADLITEAVGEELAVLTGARSDDQFQAGYRAGIAAASKAIDRLVTP